MSKYPVHTSFNDFSEANIWCVHEEKNIRQNFR